MPLDIEIDAADLMTQVVTIEVLPTPQHKGKAGAPSESGWAVERSDVPCLILPRQTKPEERAMQPANVINLKLIFAAAIELDTTRRVIYDDPAQGRRVFRPEAIRNVAELNQIWVADAQEVIA